MSNVYVIRITFNIFLLTEYTFVKKDVFHDLTQLQLVELDVGDEKNQRSHLPKEVDIGLGAESVLKVVYHFLIRWMETAHVVIGHLVLLPLSLYQDLQRLQR